MKVGEIGIIDHPITDAGVIVRIERISASRASVSYYKKGGTWTAPASRKVRVWISLSNEADLDRKAKELMEAFLLLMKEKSDAVKRHDERRRAIAAS